MPRVRLLTSVAWDKGSWDEGEEVEMTPAQASVWADGVRGEIVRPSAPIETPERAVVQRRGGFTTPETRRK